MRLGNKSFRLNIQAGMLTIQRSKDTRLWFAALGDSSHELMYRGAIQQQRFFVQQYQDINKTNLGDRELSRSVRKFMSA